MYSANGRNSPVMVSTIDCSTVWSSTLSPSPRGRALPAAVRRARVQQRAVDVEEDMGHGRGGYPATSWAMRAAARRGRLTRISSATR